MKPLYNSQKVKYVGADGGITDATIEQVEGTNARFASPKTMLLSPLLTTTAKHRTPFTWPKKKPRPPPADAGAIESLCARRRTRANKLNPGADAPAVNKKWNLQTYNLSSG